MKIETTPEDIAKMTALAIIGMTNQMDIDLSDRLEDIKTAIENDIVKANSIQKSVVQYDKLIKIIHATVSNRPRERSDSFIISI